MENTTINISDLFVLRNAIEVATARGAFRASELSTVGQTFDKLAAFLADVEAQAQANAEAEATETEGEVETTEA